MKCKKCDYEVNKLDKFCSNCGAKVEKEELDEKLKEKIEENFYKKAEKFDEEDINKVLEEEEVIEEKANSEQLKKYVDKIKTMIELVKDYARGDYRKVPNYSLGLIVTCLVYVFSWLDVIPDPIPIFGLLDDAFVIYLTLKSVGLEVKKYEKWKDETIDCADIIITEDEETDE